MNIIAYILYIYISVYMNNVLYQACIYLFSVVFIFD